MRVMSEYSGNPEPNGCADLLYGQCEDYTAVSYTHLRAHETVLDLVCRLLLEKKKTYDKKTRQDSKYTYT